MRLVRITYNAITILDSILSIVEQNQWKKNYRAKHAKLAKASPTPLFFQIISWRPWRSLRRCLGHALREIHFFSIFRRRKNSKMFG
jgi:hypothetical protein